MRPARPALAALLLLVTVAGCDQPVGGKQPASDWAAERYDDLDCPDADVRQVGLDYYDMTGDRIPEAFVTLRCGPTAGAETDQLEVFEGGKSMRDARKLAVMVRQHDNAQLDGHVIFYNGSPFAVGRQGGSLRTFGLYWVGKGDKRRLHRRPASLPSELPGCN
nr:hypothetical protein [uncultured Actinoplanes sp.]